MIIDDKANSRAGIFCVYDKDGIIDDYIIVLLDALRKHLGYILTMVNGKLTPEGRDKLKTVCDEIIVRKNKGLDSWAYKEGIDYIGWDKLNEYDELIMFNDTIMGPVNSFEKMFEVMASRDLDFWGITKFHHVDYNPIESCEYNYIPEHLQTYFIGVRKSLFNTEEYQHYWNDFPVINTYTDAVGKHEMRFTKYFSDRGYKWAAYVDSDHLKSYNVYPLLYSTMEIVREKGCPIFKKRMFFHDETDILVNSAGNDAAVFFSYLKVSGRYNTDLILKNLIRKCNMEDLVRCLNLRYILSTTEGNFLKDSNKYSVAILMHIYYEDLINQMCNYATYAPEDADIYITTSDEEKKKKIETIFKARLKNRRIEVRVIENRGRDVSALLVGMKDAIYSHDIICYLHDKKTTQLYPGSVGKGFAKKCYQNIIPSRLYVKQILGLFANNPRLGMLTPPIPIHGHFFGNIGNEWGPNFKRTKELANKIGLKVDLRKDKMPIAPFGSVFWFRSKAMYKLFDLNWEYKDFPEGFGGIDGSLLHAIERVYPFVAQDAGYYSAIVMTDRFAETEYDSLKFYVKGINSNLTGFTEQDMFHGQKNEIKQYPKDILGIYRENSLKYQIMQSTSTYKILNAIYSRIKRG